jgi:glutathione S-transferase
MFTLYQFPNHWDINSSPFCLKTETMLKVFNLHFTIENDLIKMEKAAMPKGKLPAIKDDETGKIVSDSNLILDYIESKYKISFNHKLSDFQKAVSHSFKKMIEEHLYWISLYSRWFDAKNSSKTIKEYFGQMPQAMIDDIFNKTKRDFDGTGIGLHSEEEIYAFGIKDLKAISSLLRSSEGFLHKKGHFVFSHEISELDIIIYSFVGQIIWVKEIDSPLKKYIENEAGQVISKYINFIQNFLNGDVATEI